MTTGGRHTGTGATGRHTGGAGTTTAGTGIPMLMPNEMPARAVLAVAAARATVMALIVSIFFIPTLSTGNSYVCSLSEIRRISLLISHLRGPWGSMNKIVWDPSICAFAVALSDKNLSELLHEDLLLGCRIIV